MSGWMGVACKPPVGYYLHHCRRETKMDAHKEFEKVFISRCYECSSKHIYQGLISTFQHVKTLLKYSKN